jgi:hypothetical protein
MPEKVLVKFKVTAPDSVKYWLAIDNDDLVVINHETTIESPRVSRRQFCLSQAVSV